MIKRWSVECQVVKDDVSIIEIIVRANTQRKAEIKAHNECLNRGYTNVEIIDSEEVSG
jgi:hypothetical protein